MKNSKWIMIICVIVIVITVVFGIVYFVNKNREPKPIGNDTCSIDKC